MTDSEAVIARVHEAFGANEYPGDAFLLESAEGCEPFEEAGAFTAYPDWRALEPGFLDDHYAALSFFSQAGFRYYLPAYLVADLRGALRTADPVFHLTHGFYDSSVSVPLEGRVVERRLGRSVLVNPRRYGALTSFDYARYRLSVFTREESGAIVAYLEHRRHADADGLEAPRIDAALEAFWRERAQAAPTAADLRRHLAEEAG